MLLHCEGGEFDGRDVQVREDDALVPKVAFRVADIDPSGMHSQDYVLGVAGAELVLRPHLRHTPRAMRVVVPD
jgi:hypothetical protein